MAATPNHARIQHWQMSTPQPNFQHDVIVHTPQRPAATTLSATPSRRRRVDHHTSAPQPMLLEHETSPRLWWFGLSSSAMLLARGSSSHRTQPTSTSSHEEPTLLGSLGCASKVSRLVTLYTTLHPILMEMASTLDEHQRIADQSHTIIDNAAHYRARVVAAQMSRLLRDGGVLHPDSLHRPLLDVTSQRGATVGVYIAADATLAAIVLSSEVLYRCDGDARDRPNTTTNTSDDADDDHDADATSNVQAPPPRMWSLLQSMRHTLWRHVCNEPLGLFTPNTLVDLNVWCGQQRKKKTEEDPTSSMAAWCTRLSTACIAEVLIDAYSSLYPAPTPAAALPNKDGDDSSIMSGRTQGVPRLRSVASSTRNRFRRVTSEPSSSMSSAAGGVAQVPVPMPPVVTIAQRLSVFLSKVREEIGDLQNFIASYDAPSKSPSRDTDKSVNATRIRAAVRSFLAACSKGALRYRNSVCNDGDEDDEHATSVVVRGIPWPHSLRILQSVVSTATVSDRPLLLQAAGDILRREEGRLSSATSQPAAHHAVKSDIARVLRNWQLRWHPDNFIGAVGGNTTDGSNVRVLLVEHANDHAQRVAWVRDAMLCL